MSDSFSKSALPIDKPRETAMLDYDKLLERFRYFLKLRGLSLTRERRQILETICDMASHFNVDDLFFAVHGAGRKVSKATLYRTVQLLIESRILRETASADSGRQTAYELADQGVYHGHFVCQHCGQVIEFRGPTLERFINDVSTNNQFLSLTAQITFSGVCNECIKSNPDSLRKETCVPFLKYAQTRKT